jgi:hypothetical protein
MHVMQKQMLSPPTPGLAPPKRPSTTPPGLSSVGGAAVGERGPPDLQPHISHDLRAKPSHLIDAPRGAWRSLLLPCDPHFSLRFLCQFTTRSNMHAAHAYVYASISCILVKKVCDAQEVYREDETQRIVWDWRRCRRRALTRFQTPPILCTH